MMAAVSCSRVPKITVIVGNSLGYSNSLMVSMVNLSYSKLPKNSNTLKLQTPEIVMENKFSKTKTQGPVVHSVVSLSGQNVNCSSNYNI